MKKRYISLIFLIFVICCSSYASASLIYVGTVSQWNYALIYDDEAKLLWVDETFFSNGATWEGIDFVASDIQMGFNDNYNWNTGVVDNIDDQSFSHWRPPTLEQFQHLYAEAINLICCMGLGDTSFYPFENILTDIPYWTDNRMSTENGYDAYVFSFADGASSLQVALDIFNPSEEYHAAGLICRQADITFTPSPVPEPATMLLLGSGLVGLVGFKKKEEKETGK